MLSDVKKVKSFLITTRKTSKSEDWSFSGIYRSICSGIHGAGSADLCTLQRGNYIMENSKFSERARKAAWLADERYYVRDSRAHIHHPANDLVRQSLWSMQAKGKMWQSRPVVETQNVCGSSFWFTYWKTGREKFASFTDLLLRLQSKSLNICTAKYCFSWKQKCDEFWPGKSKHNGT